MELVKALTEISSLIAGSHTQEDMFCHLVQRTCYETGSDFSVVFTLSGAAEFHTLATSHRKRDEYSFVADGDFEDFLRECTEYIVSHKADKGPFPQLLLRETMKSAAAFPLRVKNELKFILILNSGKDMYYNEEKLLFLESSCRVMQEALGRVFSRE